MKALLLIIVTFAFVVEGLAQANTEQKSISHFAGTWILEVKSDFPEITITQDDKKIVIKEKTLLYGLYEKSLNLDGTESFSFREGRNRKYKDTFKVDAKGNVLVVQTQSGMVRADGKTKPFAGGVMETLEISENGNRLTRTQKRIAPITPTPPIVLVYRKKI